MISDRVIANCIEEAGRIGSAEMMVFDVNGEEIAGTPSAKVPEADVIQKFAKSADKESEMHGLLFIKIYDEDMSVRVLSPHSSVI